VELVEWINEATLRRHPFRVQVTAEGGGAETLELVPDGLFTLARGSQGKTYYLEVDRGSQLSPGKFSKSKVQAYLALIGSAASPVLISVPTEARRAQLSRWILK